MKDKIKAIKEYLRFFPDDRSARENLHICEYSDELGIELHGGCYPRLEYGFLVLNSQIKVGKKYRLTNSTTKFEQNGVDTIIVWAESCGRLAFVDEGYWSGIGDEWRDFINILKSYNPIDYDELNNNYVYDLENGKKLINEYDAILKTFKEKIAIKVNEINIAKKRAELEKLKKELGE